MNANMKRLIQFHKPIIPAEFLDKWNRLLEAGKSAQEWRCQNINYEEPE